MIGTGELNKQLQGFSKGRSITGNPSSHYIKPPFYFHLTHIQFQRGVGIYVIED